MPHRHPFQHYVKPGRSLSTVKRLHKQGVDLDNETAVSAALGANRSRRGCGKYSPRKTAPTLETGLAPVMAIEAETVAYTPTEIVNDVDSTLARLETAERVAHARYQQTGNWQPPRRRILDGDH